MRHVSAPELAAWLADPGRPRPFLLDVRERWEWDICRIDGATLMEMSTVPARIDDLDEDAQIVCICHHGVRSLQVATYLEREGFANVANLTGGIDAWAALVDRLTPTY